MPLRRWIQALLVVFLPLPLSAPAEPLDLADARPRWVAVQLGVARNDDSLATPFRYTHWLPAWLARRGPERVRVAVAGRLVEAHVLAPQNPVPDSFSDFVWEIDCGSGHVTSATLEGQLRHPIDWGLFSTNVNVDIDVSLSTLGVGGYERPRRRFGEVVYRYCAEPGSEDCTIVDAAAYDPRSGEVRAVGFLEARSVGLSSRTFSPVGSARFAELPEPGAVGAGPDPYGPLPLEAELPSVTASPEVSAPPIPGTSGAARGGPPVELPRGASAFSQ